MELYEVLRTTFAAREFTAEPVPDEVLARILDQARFAPSGGNRQGWRVIVVRNPVTKRALADLSAFAAQRYAAQVVCVDVKVVASMDQDLGRVGIISGASIYPFACNILPVSRH